MAGNLACSSTPTACSPISIMAARGLLGMSPKQYIAKHGRGMFWKRLATPNFYGDLPEMPDARVLFDAVKHLKPTILTGFPLGNWAAPQKVEWAAEHFPGVPIITCMARDKHKHMHPGDVLVDDREKHRAEYEAAGVVFVHHKNAEDSLRQLAKIFPSVKAPEGADRLSRGFEVDLLDPLRPEHRLTARPARRGRRALADRLKQDPAAVRVEVRQGRGGAESRRQPRPRAAPISRS